MMSFAEMYAAVKKTWGKQEPRAWEGPLTKWRQVEKRAMEIVKALETADVPSDGVALELHPEDWKALGACTEGAYLRVYGLHLVKGEAGTPRAGPVGVPINISHFRGLDTAMEDYVLGLGATPGRIFDDRVTPATATEAHIMEEERRTGKCSLCHRRIAAKGKRRKKA